MSLTINFFKSYSEKAKELSDKIKKELEDFLRDVMGIEANVIISESKGLKPEGDKPASAFKVLQSALNGEIVIIDASIEECDGYDLGINYECITPATSSLDNILIVSRTELPLNYIPCRSNVALLGRNDISAKELFGDKFDDELKKIMPCNDKGKYKKEYSNEFIMAWLKYTLLKMDKNGRLNREHLPKLDVSNFTDEVFKREMEIMRENGEAIKKENGNKRKSFISYRSKYYPKSDKKESEYTYSGKCGKEFTIEDVVTKVKDYHENSAEWDEPFYYPNGLLSNELMPEVRRWAFVAMPDRVIREADEFWIFETKHKKGTDGKPIEAGYWDSWWCLGEFLTIVRMKYSGQLKKDFKLMIFDPDTDEIIEIPHDEIPSMTDEQNRELARYFANADFLEAGYESMGNMRKMRNKCLFVRWIYFQLLKRFVWPQIMPSEEIKNFKFKYYNESIESHVYDPEFMNNRIYVDKSKEERGVTRKEIFSDINLIWNFLNVNKSYKVSDYPGSNVIKEDNISKINDAIQKIDDKKTVKQNEHFYIFWTPRMGKRTGENNCIIETVPLYEIVDAKN